MQLRDRLVSMGIDEIEAERAIREQMAAESVQGLKLPYQGTTEGLPLFATRLVVRDSPALSSLDEVERTFVSLTPTADVHTEMVLSVEITEAAFKKVEQSLKPADRERLRDVMAMRRRHERRRNCPAGRGETSEVPQLMIRLDGVLYRQSQQGSAFVCDGRR